MKDIKCLKQNILVLLPLPQLDYFCQAVYHIKQLFQINMDITTIMQTMDIIITIDQALAFLYFLMRIHIIIIDLIIS